MIKETQILKTLNKATEQINDLIEAAKSLDSWPKFTFALSSLDLIKRAKEGFEIIIKSEEKK